MAQVLSPLATPNSMSMLRSPQDAFQGNPNQAIRMPRNSMYNPQLSTAMAYRGPSQNAAAYTFQNQNQNQNPQARKQDRRKSAGPVARHAFQQPMPPYHESSSSAASSTSSSSNQSGIYSASKDDSVLGYHDQGSLKNHRLSANMAASMSTPDLSASSNQFVRPSPDRYRRISKQPEMTSSSEQHDSQRSRRPMSAPIPTYSSLAPTQSPVAMNPPSPLRRSETDDGVSGSMSNSARYKRRSVATMGAAPVFAQRSTSSPAVINGPSWSQVVSGKHVYQGALPPPSQQGRPSQHTRTNSGEHRAQGMRPASARHSSYVSKSNTLRPTTAPNNPFPRPRSSLGTPVSSATSVPPRPSTATGPPKADDPAARPSTAAGRLTTEEPKPSQSPAVQQLSALKDKSSQKGVKSRIRRAFSFSSSSELRKATAENNLAAERAKVRKERFEIDQADPNGAIVANQEANGLGNNIYSGQGQFAGSTDNLSMASTASSASMMLRSIGRGMKKSSRNLRGLFRPKSMIGPPTASEFNSAPSQVTLVNIEAEREAVNVNIDPHDVPGGGTNFPKLERNSIDQMSDAHSIGSGSRKSIVAGDRERAEILAAVRKGILKRSGTSSPTSSPVIIQGERPQATIPTQHSAPGSPTSHLGVDAVDSYFAGQTNSASTRSLPTQGSRNVSFGQRVQFYDVWSPSEYDRRGDIATCNRLTPMLAQQIKEELNSFKMEMEVHELSKPHTHFF